jgi:uncharacterized protein YjbJ (UPF0337 family)
MEWQRISGNWAHWRSHVQRRWGRLTREQLDAIGGQREPLISCIQDAYGLTREEAGRQLRNWERNLSVEERPVARGPVNRGPVNRGG